MEHIFQRCTDCGTRLHLDESKAGLTERCPNCGQTFWVADGSEANRVKKPRWRRRIALTIILLIVIYPFSYAPALRLYPFFPPSDEYLQEYTNFPLYSPIEWLIDHTPARRPLLRWADLWGAGEKMKTARWRRRWDRFFRDAPDWQSRSFNDDSITKPFTRGFSPRVGYWRWRQLEDYLELD